MELSYLWHFKSVGWWQTREIKRFRYTSSSFYAFITPFAEYCD